MAKTRKARRLADTYRFPGFRPLETVQGIFGDPRARVITLVRRGKKRSAGCVVPRTGPGTTAVAGGPGTCPVASTASISIWRYGACSVGGATA